MTRPRSNLLTVLLLAIVAAMVLHARPTQALRCLPDAMVLERIDVAVDGQLSSTEPVVPGLIHVYGREDGGLDLSIGNNQVAYKETFHAVTTSAR